MTSIDAIEDRTLRGLLIQARTAAKEGRHGASVRLLVDAESRAAWLFMDTTHPLRASILATIKAQQAKTKGN